MIEVQSPERVQASVVEPGAPRLCGCGKEYCRPGQRTGLSCHAELMKEYRHARPALQRMQIAWALIRTGTYPDATRLAAYLEVSAKSVHRDIEFMRERLLFDIRFDGSRNGYYTAPGPAQCPFCHPGEEVLAQLVMIGLRTEG